MRLLRILRAYPAALLLASLPAAAKIDTMFVNNVSGPKLCSEFAMNPEIDYGDFMSRGHRIPVPRGTTFQVMLLGFGADLATGTEDDIANLSSSIAGHGTTDKIGGGIFFGQMEQTGYVTVQIHAHNDAALGNGHVTVKWLTGTETIPLDVVASCGTPTPVPTPRSSPPPPPKIPGAGVARPALLPDLIPSDFVNFRTGVDPNDCNGAFTGPRRFAQPDLKFGVRNISPTDVNTPFVVLLRKADGTELRRVQVPNLAGNGKAEFDFRRAQSDVCVVKGPNGFGCSACPGTTPVNDRGIEVVVDFDNAVVEASETNNSRKIN